MFLYKNFSGKLSLGLATVLLLSACSMPAADGSSEHLLRAEGDWKMVEQDAHLMPEDMHGKAKAGVNVHSMRRDMKYASQVKKDMKRDTNFRLLVLERQMEDLHSDMARIVPEYKPRRYDSYASLGLPEPDPKADALKARIEKVKAKKAAPAKANPSYKAPDLSGSSSVKRIRMGQHPGKTRLVLDLNKPSHFSYDLDNDEKLLLIDISGAGWSAADSKKFAKHPLVASYSAHDNGDGGTMLVLELKKKAKVLMSSALKPNPKAGGYHRIVLDLAKL